jgi:hypothetical protein
MSYAIGWSRQSELDIAGNMDYLAREWGNNVLNKFLAEVEKALKK